MKKPSKKNPPRPTSSELEILSVVWDKRDATVRQVHEELNHRKPTGYTTVLKLMQIMAEKGLLARDEAVRAHVYRAGVPRVVTQNQLIDDLLWKVFGGSASDLVMRALSSERASKEEKAIVRRWLEEAEGRKG